MNETGQEKKLSETEKDVNRIDAFSNIVKQNHDFERGAESAMDVVNNRKDSDTTVSDMVKTAGMMKAKSMSPATPAKRGKKELNDPLMSRRTFNKIAIASLTGVGIVAVLTKYGSLVEKIATFIANNINDKKNDVKLITEVEAKAAEIALYVNPEIKDGKPETVIPDLRKYFSDMEIAYLAHNANDDFYFQKLAGSNEYPSYVQEYESYLESHGVEVAWGEPNASSYADAEFKKLLNKNGFVEHADGYIAAYRIGKKSAEIAYYVNPEIENGDPKTVISDLKKYFSDIEIAYLAHNANDDFYFQKITYSEDSPSYTDACKNYLESNGIEIDWTAESAAQKVEIEFKKLLDKKGFVKHADNYINVMQLKEEEEQKKNGGLGL